ncbi:hypothetical protein SLEP1_g15166 [Rubroshorea leprosula]|uniref:Uncharacterized protein n=1 Tax=Rubroshorea leprosula TaxID=152421 RepID=A0AAV5ISG5_9ROSI|nr:hypothetical protein SLEP1_g15166 [Rubroshorea leprosula]
MENIPSASQVKKKTSPLKASTLVHNSVLAITKTE